MHPRAPQTALIFHSQAAGQTGHCAQAARAGCGLGQLLSTSKMALPRQESTKNNLKWVLLLQRKGSLPAALPTPSLSAPALPLRWPC